MQIVSLPLAKLHSVTDAFEIFNGDSATSAFSGFYNLLTDAMVDISGVSAFFLGEVFKNTFGRLGAFALKASTLPTATMAYSSYNSTTIDISVRVSGDINYATIDTKPFVRVKALRFGNVASLQDVPFTPTANQIGFTLCVLEKVKLLLSSLIGHLCPTVNCPKRDNLIWFPAKNTAVIGNAAQLGKSALRLFVNLVTIRNLGNNSHCHLRRQSELLSNGIVAGVMQIVLTKRLCHPGMITNILRSAIGGKQSFA